MGQESIIPTDSDEQGKSVSAEKSEQGNNDMGQESNIQKEHVEQKKSPSAEKSEQGNNDMGQESNIPIESYEQENLREKKIQKEVNIRLSFKSFLHCCRKNMSILIAFASLIVAFVSCVAMWSIYNLQKIDNVKQNEIKTALDIGDRLFEKGEKHWAEAYNHYKKAVEIDSTVRRGHVFFLSEAYAWAADSGISHPNSKFLFEHAYKLYPTAKVGKILDALCTEN